MEKNTKPKPKPKKKNLTEFDAEKKIQELDRKLAAANESLAKAAQEIAMKPQDPAVVLTNLKTAVLQHWGKMNIPKGRNLENAEDRLEEAFFHAFKAILQKKPGIMDRIKKQIKKK